MSMDMPFEEGDDNTLVEVIPSKTPSTDSNLDSESLSKDIDRVLSILPIRTRDIVKMNFGLGCQQLSLEDIGNYFGLSRERTRQLLYEAIEKLGESKGASMLRNYL